MRTHGNIVRAHGAAKLARDLEERGTHVHSSTPQRWAERGSIPAEYWPVLVEMGVASIAELVAGAPSRKRRAAA